MSPTIKVSKTRCGVPVLKPVNPIERSEDMEAIDFYQHAISYWPELGMLLFHVTNEGKRSHRKGQQLKEAGLIKGVSDYICLMPSGPYPYAVIELKREDKGNASKEQKQFLRECQDKGAFVCIAHGYHAAVYALRAYINNEKI